MAHSETHFDPKKVELSRDILKFLKDGEGKMDLGKFQNVTLVLGFTGSGKSTLTQFITSNDDGLMAEENGVDTGEFTITDKNNNVCKDTIESCTIIPTLYVDKETKAGFYDCPGFGDTRSVKHDISVTYFIKKVVDSVDSVKLLLTVNYPSVRQGVDRQNFMLLVKNVVNMVKDVEKFKDGIALVVTKVDNQYRVKKGQAVLVPDKSIIANIAKFLEGAKASLSAKLSHDADPKTQAFHSNSIKFIDIILEKNGDVYPKIGLFRRPDAEGKLRETPLLKSGKVQLDKILRQNIRYIPKIAEDFGYTLSADSLNHMHALMLIINEDLAMNFRSLVAPIQEHYRSQERGCQDIDELNKNFTQGYETLLKIKETKTYSSPMVLMNEIVNLAQAENIPLSGEMMGNVAHYDNFLNFLNSISGLKTTPLQWLQGLNDVVENMSSSRNWLDLLVNLKNALSKYEVLNEVRRNQTAADVLRDQIVSYVESGSDKGLSTVLQAFLRLVFKEDFDREYGKIRSINNVSAEEWKLLKSLVSFKVLSLCDAQAVQSQDYPLFNFEPPRYMMLGQYIRLSDIKLPDSINGTRCWNKRINIFALRKVFIDDDFIKRGEKIELVIMAPTWEVIGSPKINLDGDRGLDYHPPKAADGYTSSDRHGSDGQDGGHGGAGGFFWGIGQKCINCQHLTISANGGKGGDGQDGGDGADGMNFFREYKGDQDGMLITLVYNTKVWDKLRYGQTGGDGGRGGAGGLGGPKGTVQFVMFEDGTKPKISAIQGQGGRGGAGGAPGEGGRSDRVIQRVRAIFIIPWEKNEVQNLPSASSGSWGSNGLTPWSAASLPEKYPSPTETLANYTQLLQFKIFKGPTDTTSRLFIQNLETTKMADLDRHRWRRSTSQFEQPENSAASSASTKVSIINQAILLISNMVRPFWEHMAAINWRPEESHEIPKTTGFNGIAKGAQKTFEIPKISGQSQQSQESHSSLAVQSNLLLLDYLVRMNVGGKSDSKRRNHIIKRDDYAHRMAYSAYSPRGNTTIRAAINHSN